MFFSVKSFNFALLFSFMLFNALLCQSVRTEQVIRLENPNDNSSYILLKAPDNLVGQHTVDIPSTGVAATLPAGMIVPYAGSTAPDGWLLCDGSAVSTTTYSNLYNVIGITYGGSGSNFNLPDLRGRVPIGVSPSHTLASSGGAETHTLTVEEIPEHNHLLGGRQTGGYNANNINNAIFAGGSTAQNIFRSDMEPNVYSKNTAITNTGGDQAHNNMQPYLTLNYIIKY